MPQGPAIVRYMVASIALVCLIVAAWIGYHTWPREIDLLPYPHFPRVDLNQGRLVVRPYPEYVAAEIASFTDELLAYLHFEYLRSLALVDEAKLFLTVEEVRGKPVYRICLLVENDLLSAIPYLYELKAVRYVAGFEFLSWTAAHLARMRDETHFFDEVYHQPVRQKLESLGAAELQSSLARFLLFKSKTDPRIRRQVEPVPQVLSRMQAQQLAADMIAVAQFYEIPLDFFLGIGAMENNYMDVPGDLEHVVWKKRAEKGDIVLKRRRGRVLVRNYSIGMWQITRETLRFAHSLYLRDMQDYSALPARLQPPKILDLNHVSSPVLTTYAGLLFRNLLDRFEGNVEKAVAAYNGGSVNPNLQYAEQVTVIADYARRILEHAAARQAQALRDSRIRISRRSE